MNINFTSPCNQTGYGYSGLNILLNLDKLGHNVSWWPIGGTQAEQKHHDVLQKCMNNQQSFDSQAPSIRLWHQFDLAQHAGGGFRYNFTFFELDKFRPNEIIHLESGDRLIVSSQWARWIILKETKLSPEEVHMVPLGVDRTIFNDNKNILPMEGTKKPYVFLNVGKLEIRKGHDVLIEAFNEAFEENDNVELWMMWESQHPNIQKQLPEWKTLVDNSKLAGKIKLLPQVGTQQEVAAIMQAADCGVFPAKAEAWNLELLEMMSCGKQIIATNFSGHTEFVNSQNSLLIEIDETEPAFDGVWFHGDVGNWAAFGEHQKEQLITHMRHFCKAGDQFPENDGGIQTAKDFSWKNSAQKLVEIIS